MNIYKKYFTDDITINLSPGDHFKHGKFKNKDAVVKSFGKNEKGEDIIITPEGKEIQLLKIRLIKEANQKYNKIIDTVIKSYIKKNSRNEFFTGDCVNFATALYDFVEMNFENIYKNYELMTMYDEFVSHTVLYLDGLYLDASGINTKQSIENKIKSGAGKITWKKDEGIYNIFGKDSKKILYGLQDEFNKLFPIEANFEENTKRYKKFFNSNKHVDYFSLKEGVVYSLYLENIKNQFQQLYPSIQKLKFSSINALCFWLSRNFKSYYIKFRATDEILNSNTIYDLFGIVSASTLTNKKNRIQIKCNVNLLKIQSINLSQFNKFVEIISEVIGHELVHRYQMVQVEGRKLRNFIFGCTPKETILYLSSKQEIMARAWQIIEEFRFSGLKDKNILSIMQSNKNTRMVAYSPTLMDYLQFFNTKDNVFKILYKYIYMYINNEIEED